MKPVLWRFDNCWYCAYLGSRALPPSQTEEFIKWVCDGTGNTPQEAYANWEHECDLFREELNSDKSNS